MPLQSNKELSNRFHTYRNEHGYWVAKIPRYSQLYEGEFNGTDSWAKRRRVAIRNLKEGCDEIWAQLQADRALEVARIAHAEKQKAKSKKKKKKS